MKQLGNMEGSNDEHARFRYIFKEDGSYIYQEKVMTHTKKDGVHTIWVDTEFPEPHNLEDL